jgi:thiol-disulfide isomerase/thioredoxin
MVRPDAPPERSRARPIAAVAIVAIVIALVAWKFWSMAASRPRIERPSPYSAFGVDRASVAAPPLELVTMDGSKFSLAQARGQLVVVNFWATWCPPCRDEMPSMVQLGRELSERHPGRFRMLAVSVDEGWEPIREYFAAPPFGGVPSGLTIALDPGQAATKAYYCTARGSCPDIKFPETYIVDGSGRLVAYVVGPRNWSNPAARELLEQLVPR